MSTFNPKRVFENPQDDVRDRDDLLQQIQALPPHGVLWPLVGARRSGKTWTLRALERLLNQKEPGCAHYEGSLPPELRLDGLRDVRYLLLDEPLFAAEDGRDASEFLEWCAKRHNEKRTRIVVAMSPAEWKCLLRAVRKSGKESEMDLLYVTPLSAKEARKVARGVPWAEQILDDPGLPLGWAANPHLLEFLFSVVERSPIQERKLTPELLQHLLSRCDGETDIEYFPSVFVNGLNQEQRRLIREVARGKSPHFGQDEVLIECGLLKREPQRCVVADPVLRALVTPLRIHHLSDVHVGPKSATHGDAKEPGVHGVQFARGAGVALAREKYRDHLRESSESPEVPHVIIISGDVAETGEETQFKQAREWVDSLIPLLENHPLLKSEDNRILLVGGNHDVDWRFAGEPEGGRQRHHAFKKHFEGFIHPRLEQPPGERAPAIARYSQLGLSVVLLGSAEFGGEHEKAPEWEAVLSLVERLKKEALEEEDRQKAQALRDRVMHLDPGLVHHTDLRWGKNEMAGYPVRIAVLHHPVSPLPGTEIAKFSGLLNAGDVKEVMMREQVALVLHGHAHKGWFGKEQWPGAHEWMLRIAAAPSLASREIQEQHGFNQIEVSRLREQGRREYLVTVQRYIFNGSSWVEDKKMSFRPGRPEDES